jgi:hypothetical protein
VFGVGAGDEVWCKLGRWQLLRRRQRQPRTAVDGQRVDSSRHGGREGRHTDAAVPDLQRGGSHTCDCDLRKPGPPSGHVRTIPGQQRDLELGRSKELPDRLRRGVRARGRVDKRRQSSLETLTMRGGWRQPPPLSFARSARRRPQPITLRSTGNACRSPAEPGGGRGQAVHHQPSGHRLAGHRRNAGCPRYRRMRPISAPQPPPLLIAEREWGISAPRQ